MKTKRLIIVIIFFSPFFIKGQPINLLLNAPESGTQNHEARNSITFANGYAYSPAAGDLTAAIVNPIVNGSVYYNSIVDPTTRTINTSYLVGSTNGSFSVNPMGAATYSIPIEAPPGVNGLNPNLSLVYSSMGGSGIAGYGWQLSGISAITRTSQTFFQDGQTKGVNLDQNDRFALDGQRLVCTFGPYGIDGSQYRTESEIFSRVTALGVSGTGPEKFKTETKSGHIFEYGYTTDAVQKLTGFAEAVSWYVSSVSDLFGNKINYTYLNQDGVLYPAIIEYGTNRIVLYYKKRTDVTNSYFKGVKLQQKLLLDKVEVSYNSAVLKTYELKYNYLYNNYCGQSALNEVIEYGTSGSRLNSTAFSYQQPGNIDISYPQSYSNSNISTNSILYPGDFNGDGFEDILALKKTDMRTTILYLNNKAGGFSLAPKSYTTNFYIKELIVSDLNGDGMDDLITVEHEGDPNQYGISHYDCQFSNGSNLGLLHEFKRIQNYSTGITGDFDNRMSDFDGDGFDDFLLITKYNPNLPSVPNGWKIFSCPVDSTNFTNKYSGTISSWGDKVYTADLNGDGKTDIWVLDGSGLKIYSVNGNSLTTLYTSTWPNKDHYLQLGDFNGDGKTDMFVYGYSTYDWSEWQTRLSTGTSFEGHYFTAKKTNLKNDKVYVGDFNGDGRTDIMALSKNSSNNPRQYYFIANLNGDGISSEYKEQTYLNKDYSFTLGDYDGNGQKDVIVTSVATGYRISKTTGTTDILMKNIGNGFGNVTGIYYQKLTDSGSNYEKGNGVANFPVFTYQGPLNVVTYVSYINVDNSPLYYGLRYAYEGLKIHRQGKGFLCYEKTTVTEVYTGISTESLSGYNTTWFSPELLRITKRSYSNIISEVTNDYSYKTYYGSSPEKRFFPYVYSSTERNELTLQAIFLRFDYDDYGNVTFARKFAGATTNMIENIDNSTQWLLGRVTNSSTTFSGTGSPITKQVGRTYSPTSNLIVTETYFPSTSSELLKSYEYNTCGTLKKETITGDAISRTTDYEYETDNIRVKKITDPLAHATNRVYNNFGWLQSETDYLNNTVTYDYDNLGRQNLQNNPDGSQSTTSLQWFTGGEPANARYYHQMTGNDGEISKTWYDKIGREIRSDVKGFNGNMIAVLKSYNFKGELASVSDPYYEGLSPTQNTTFTYDDYGRQAGINRFSGRNTAFSYDTNIVTETTNGHTYTKTYNVDGTMVQSVDPGGTLNYLYYPDGKTFSISRGGLTLATMSYDAAGNQTQLNDNSAGITSYTYSKFGEIKTQTNAKGDVTTYNYTQEGLINSRDTPEGTTTYTYNGNKQLTSITSPGSLNRSQSYDALGRMQAITETVDANSYQTSFAYDDKGRLHTRTHPSGIIEINIYDNSTGYLKQILADGQAAWTINTMDERQHVRTANYGSGSGLGATFDFDTYGLPSSTVVGSVQNYSYSFDPIKGNLNWRKNIKNVLEENFEYDANLDRLTKINRLTTLYHQTTYDDATGNIINKTDAGAYAYLNTGKPYMLSEINDSPLNYTANQNITYTSFEKVSTITESTNTYTADFVYNADYERAKMIVKNNNVAFLTRTYIGSRFMKELFNGVPKDYTFVGGDAYSAPVVIETQGTTKTPYFLLRDYLGNITHIANNDGSLKSEYSYDAWGRQRNPSDWTNYAVGSEPDLFMGRGFTGHEHLPWFNLINMNGRLYDPLVGRMLSPDPYVQMPDNTQSYNRYSYCLNNPLAYTDPTGYTWFGSVFRWGGNAFDNLGDFLNHNNIQFGIGYSTNSSNPWRGVPYSYVSTPSGANLGVGYNLSTGNVGISNNSGGFTNFYYPGYNYGRPEQIGEMAVAEGKSRVASSSGDDPLSSQLQPKIDLALEYERERRIKESTQPAIDPYYGEEPYNQYINGIDFSVFGVKRTALNSSFPFTYVFGKSTINGVYIPGNANLVHYVGYSNPPKLSIDYYGIKGYFVTFETKTNFARATLIINDSATYNLFLSTKLQIK